MSSVVSAKIKPPDHSHFDQIVERINLTIIEIVGSEVGGAQPLVEAGLTSLGTLKLG